jgi:arylsulfatase A-like enzyme
MSKSTMKKNVILVTIDTLRRDVFGCYGAAESRTPFMDSLKEHSLKFTNSYAAGPYTQASFPGILTSSYFLEFGKQKKLPARKQLISEVLKKEGIKTAGFHSNTYLSYYFGYNRGWDMFYDSMRDDVSDHYPYIRGDGINQRTLTWLESYVKKEDYAPFFLWVHYMDVHEPYVAEEKYLSRVDSSLSSDPDEMFGLFKNVILPRDLSDPKKVDTLRKLYHAKVLETDDYVKELFAGFDNLGVLDDSVVLLTSDHGDEFGEHGGLSHDGKMVNELIHVPFLIYDRDRKASEVRDDEVSGVDIPPTICGLFGVERGERFLGRDLLSDTEGDGGNEMNERDGGSRACYGEAMDKFGNKEKETDQPLYYLLKDGVKTIYRERDKALVIFDLKEDPEEKNNIASSHPEAEELKAELLNTRKQYRGV